MVGALVLSRLAEDETLSRRILDAAIGSLLHRNGSNDRNDEPALETAGPDRP
jgi:TetR/AcrR family transcriptional repressor of nem operon